MTKSEVLKNELIRQIGFFSEEKLNQLLSYAKFLEFQPDNIAKQGDMTKKFLNEYIGGTSHGSLAENIDDELYG